MRQKEDPYSRVPLNAWLGRIDVRKPSLVSVRGTVGEEAEVPATGTEFNCHRWYLVLAPRAANEQNLAGDGMTPSMQALKREFAPRLRVATRLFVHLL